MNEEKTNAQGVDREEMATENVEVAREPSEGEKDSEAARLQELHDKYVRLYAEFENYKRRVNKDKEEILKYGNEALLYELLPAIDHLEMALKHASNDVPSGLVQGVDITLREMKKTLEKFGLTEIEAAGKPFDPAVHHAMSQSERDDVEENMVVEEFRKGYLLKDKVLRPSLVAVSKNPSGGGKAGGAGASSEDINNTIEEEC